MPVLTKINTNVIADDAITGAKFAGDTYLENTATQNISGTYSENRLYTSDAYTLSGNATVNSHLTLSSVKPTADVVLTASGAYTITGTGVLSAGTLLAKANTDLTGMTGALGSTVTGGSGLTAIVGTARMPTGSVLQCLYYQKTSGDSYTTSTTFTDHVNLAISITPTSTESKIYIYANVHVYVNSHSADAWSHTNFAFERAISGGATGVVYQTAALGSDGNKSWGFYVEGDADRAMQRNPIAYLDSPNTTSACTYQVQYNAGGTHLIYENGLAYGYSDITAWEIAG